MDNDGNPLASIDSGQAELKSRYANHSVFTKFEDSTSYEDFICTKNIRPKKIFISDKLSKCDSVYVDRDLTEIAHYDGLLGIDFGEYQKGRQFILVVNETDVADAALPAGGSTYDNNKEVMFCGYNRPGAALDLNNVAVTYEWHGIEELLNEIKVCGIYSHGINTPTITGTDNYSSAKCIFNENGERDRSTYEEILIGTRHYYFNKSGIGKTDFWSIKHMLFYLKWLYCSPASPLIDLPNGLGLKLIAYVSDYINLNLGLIDKTELDTIVPKNFSIENFGVLDAIKEVLKQSKSYMMYKAYTCDGGVTIGYRKKKSIQADRDEGDQPMLIRIGKTGEPASAQDLSAGGNINCNRETKNLGRVVVLGDYLRFNSLATSLAHSSFTGVLSSDPEEYSQASGLTAFADRLALVLTATNLIETYQQNYAVIPTNMLNVTIADLGANLAEYNNESTDVKLFDGLKTLEFGRELSKGTNIDAAQKTRDAGVYVAKPSDPRLNADDGLDWVYPLLYDETNYYYFIQPVEKLQNGFSVKHESGLHSALILLEANGDNDNDTGLTEFGQYQEKSIINHLDVASEFFPDYDETNPVPFFARVNVRSDYRIKGIAEIEDYDENIHYTEIVQDPDFKLSISFKDAEYDGAGGFIDIYDGFLNGTDGEILLQIQDKAESLLEKYIVCQNSGQKHLDGFQTTLKIGDWFDKLVGEDRDIIAPSVIAQVEYDLDNKSTTLSLGS